MKTGLLGLALAALATASASFAGATQLNVKTGLWDMTYVTTLTGTPSIPQSTLDRLPPDRRAKILARISGASSRPKTTHARDCVTQKELEEGAFGPRDEAEDTCKHTVKSATSTHNENEFTCGGSPPQTGRMTVDAVTPESVKGELETTKGSMKIKMHITGKWTGSDCGNVK